MVPPRSRSGTCGLREYRLRRRDRNGEAAEMESSEHGSERMRPYPSSPRMRIPQERVQADSAEAQLIESIATLIERMDKREAQSETNQGGVEGPVWQQTIPGLQVTLSGGNGTLTDQVYLKPAPECYMGIRRLFIGGFSAGLVTVLQNGIEPVAFFSGGVQYYAKGQILLDSGDWLQISAAGITGGVTVWGKTDNFPGWHVSRYLS